jgi:hypothetical protein
MLRIRILYVRFIPTLAGAASLSSTCEQKLCPLREIFERETGCNLVVQPLTVQALTASGRIETLIVYDLDRRRRGAELKPRKQAFEAALEEIDQVSARMLGLSAEEDAWIRKRLEGFPLWPLWPRYPWELPARRRPPTRHYEEDRFR